LDTLSVKHSFAGGDLITLLPGLRHVYLKTGKKWVIYQRVGFEGFYYEGAIPSTVDSEGRCVTMNKAHFEMLKPLILSQEYIADFVEWKGEKVDIDTDKSRDSRAIPIPYSPLHWWNFFIAPELICDLSERWLNVLCATVSGGNITEKIIINRTERYNNPYIHFYFLKPYEKDILFIGTPKEYAIFCDKWQLEIEYLPVNDFLEAAQYLSNCRFFVGGQSLLFHVSDAMKIPRILEVCAPFPNTFPTGKLGFAYVNQESFELLFDKLYKKTLT